MTAKSTRKETLTGILIACLLAMAASMADVANPEQVASGSQKDIAENTNIKNDPETKASSFEELNNEDLVRQLGDESFLIREKASSLLWRRGELALDALEVALLSSNPELISRATELIRYIKVGISPDTPRHIAKLVHSFATANNDEKEDILRTLYAEKAYSQMLFMLSEMEDRTLARTLFADFKRLAHEAARVSISQGNLDGAIEQLKLAPQNETTLRSLAYLYGLTGLLGEELEKLTEMSDELVDKHWERHLNLERPGREDIRKFAIEESLMGVIANLNLLKGDPEMMYHYYSKNATYAAEAGLDVIKQQYDGAEIEFIENTHNQQVKTLSLFEGREATDLLNQTIKSMCLTGAAHLIEPYLKERYHYDAFAYLDQTERPKEALKVLGISDETSLKEFIKENTRLALAELDLEKKDQQKFRGGADLPYSDRLLNVAGFYHRRGILQITKDVLSPLLSELKKKQNDEWCKFVEDIANHGMRDLAVKVTLDRGDDNKTYGQMVPYLYDDTQDTDLIWSTLLNREGMSAEKSFRDLAVIMGVYQPEIKTYLNLQDELIKIAIRKGRESLDSMYTALHSVAMFRQDAISARKYTKLLLLAEKNEAAIPLRKLEYLRELSSCLEWREIVTLLDDDHSFINKSPRWYALYSIAKRKLGDDKEADQLLNYAKLISLGLNDDLREIAAEHYLAGYYGISTQIMERVLLVSSVDRNSNAYKYALGYLSAGDNAYINTKQWEKAAAFLMIRSTSDLIGHLSDREISNVVYYTNDFYNVQFTRGLELYQAGEKSKGLKMLTSAHKVMIGGGGLADHFYPAIRTTNLDKQYNLWVEESFEHVSRSLEQFPECANTHNTMAWLLSRAVRKLDVALEHSKKSLELSPFEAAYIDTMGEVWFAKGNRKTAIKWGEEAVRASKYGRIGASAKLRTYSLVNQLERFKTQPHPKP